MELQYSHGSPYAPSQPPDNHRSSMTGQGAHPPFQTLPPLSASYNPLLPFAYHNDSDLQAPLASRIQVATSPVDTYSAYSHSTHNQAQYYSSQSTCNQLQRPLLLQPQPFNPQNLNMETYQPFKPSITSQGRLPAICKPDSLKDQSSPLSTHWASLSNSPKLQTGHNSQPAHVVGLQGRRGNLPCEDRTTTAAAENVRGQNCAHVPTKDENGKYPCGFCAKTYLHAKHLKRHMLRHTGTRPYSCGLCNDTFSRSDILKRHFSKCSVRRGNPTGEHHLSHSRATKKSRLEAAAKARAAEETNGQPRNQPKATTDVESSSPNGAFDLSALRIGASGCSDESRPVSNRASRASSVKGGQNGNQSSFGGSSSSSYDPIGYVYSGGQITPDSITTSGAVTPFQYLHESRPSQFMTSEITFNENINSSGADLNSRTPTGSSYAAIGSMPQILESGSVRGTDLGWPPLFQSDTHDSYGNPQLDAHQLLKPDADTGQTHQTLEPKPDFGDLHFPLPRGYAPYMPTKV